MGNNTQESTENKTVKAEKAEGYQAYYQDAAGHAQFEIIAIEHRQSYIDTFQNRIPIEKEYAEWKSKTNVKVLKEASAQTAGDKTTREGYKFTPNCRKEIHDYLNTRPMAEVESMVFQMFENPEDPNPYISKEGIQTLTKYLQEKCPRIEAKRLIELMANNGLEKYILKPIDKPENGSQQDKSENKKD